MLTQDIERSLFEHLEDRADLPEGTIVHRPGERFTERTLLWIAPRLTSVDRQPNGPNRVGETYEVWTLQVSCYVKVLQKAARFLKVSELADQVRLLVDSSLRAPAAPINNQDGTRVGLMDFGPADEERNYGISVSVEGTAVPGVDAAILTTRVVVSAC